MSEYTTIYVYFFMVLDCNNFLTNIFYLVCHGCSITGLIWELSSECSGHRIPFRRRPCYKVYDSLWSQSTFRRRPCYKVYDSYGHIIPFRRRPCYKVNDSLWSQNTFQEEILLQGIDSLWLQNTFQEETLLQGIW